MSELIKVNAAKFSEPKPLPDDIQQFLDSASECGAIYFSLGSYLKHDDMPKDKLNAFIESFRPLKQKILWKYENESISNLPPNIMVRKWLSQNDILAHKNLKLFITHGGVSGNQEAIYHGVPMLMIALNGDQFRNTIQTVMAGNAIMLRFVELTTEMLTEKLNVILNDPQYSIRAKEISILLRNNPISPMEFEYAVRHKGTQLLRFTYASEMPWHVYFHLDILGALVFVIFIVVRVILMFLRIVNSVELNTEAQSKKTKQM